MDISSIRSLLTLVVQLHSAVVVAEDFTGEIGVTKPDGHELRPCCLNGGLCVLGSFCHCPGNFYGRYCEFELSRKPCGPIPHGNWVKTGCNLCLCVEGNMTCLKHAFSGCDHLPKEEEVNHLDYQNMVIFPSGEDVAKGDLKTYDDYEDYDVSHGCFLQNKVCSFLPLLCFIWQHMS